MKIRSQPLTVAAFTLVEIALSLAIIGFALVAIIGVLPFGLNVQKENREETIIVQDANYLLDAIRTGARGLNDLTNYVDTITNYRSVYNIVGANTNLVFQDTFAYTFNQAWINGTVAPANVITNGERIVGLLSTPRILPFYTNDAVQVIPGGFESNYVVAYIRALSGPAVEKAPQANPIVRDLAFRYRLIPEVTPFDNWNLNWVNQYVPGLTDEEKNTRSNAWRIARQQQVNTHEVRLLFRWPIDSQGRAGNQRQVFRTLVSGNLAEIPTATNEMTHVTWLMQPSIFLAVPNQ